MASNRADVLRALAELEVESLERCSGLQVFGLKWPCPPCVEYVTLDEAVSTKTLDIAEVVAEGRVSAIKVVNRSGRLVFLMAGGMGMMRDLEIKQGTMTSMSEPAHD